MNRWWLAPRVRDPVRLTYDSGSAEAPTKTQVCSDISHEGRMLRVGRQGSGKRGDARDEGSPRRGVGYSFLELLRV